ncbi:unnamed protein product [Zymoseptoria tritici ST99CH_3D7]|uniref:GRIP domain-containing protein n=1 Tax=Zymoseptoria tritici (strain ST99CH_3D7) TaxID=1276538 RepID=A0A1X7RMJ1_ZYMT9|nr:unnamed protein product [Zymoseptoria tritici ST99CH_3D7]
MLLRMHASSVDDARYVVMAISLALSVFGASIRSYTVKEFTEQTYAGVEQAKRFILGSSSLASHETAIRKETTNRNHALDDALLTMDLGHISELLESEFDLVAVGSWSWLHELRDEGIEVAEVAELLYEQEKDRPWIYFDRPQGHGKRPQMHSHIEGCVHNGVSPMTGQEHPSLYDFLLKPKNITSSESRASRPDTHGTIATLCGLAGIVPPPKRRFSWDGDIRFQCDSIALVSYLSDSASLQTIWTRTQYALKGISAAFAELQQAGLCCDSFTLIRQTPKSQILVDGRRLFVELYSIQSRTILEFLDLVETTPDLSDDFAVRCCAHHASTILPDTLSGLRLSKGKSISTASVERCVHLCALAVQVLCLGLVSYCQAHTGAVELFFLQHKLTEIQLFGSRPIASTGPRLRARLQDLTCFGSMLRGPVLVFGFARELTLDDDLLTKYDLLASPQDIIDTWGPGNFVVGANESGEQGIVSIMIGGGCIAPGVEQQGTYHWSRDLRKAFNQEDDPFTTTQQLSERGKAEDNVDRHLVTSHFLHYLQLERSDPKKLEVLQLIAALLGWDDAQREQAGLVRQVRRVSETDLAWNRLPRSTLRRPTMQLTEKIIIATSVTLNTKCSMDEEDCLKVSDGYRDPLGTFEPYWALAEQQAGVQAGQYATLVYNQTWVKRIGMTLKELQMLQPTDEILPFLESTWGLQVSFCSGLAGRVKMRELLADVLPALMERKVPQPSLWKELRDSHAFIETLKQGDLAAWLSDASVNHSACYDFACVLIRSITMMLRDTGIDPSEKHFVVAWMPSQPFVPPQCIKIPVNRTNFWTKVLQDTSDCATFAYLTTACLQIQGHGCRNTHSPWHGEIALMETEVHRHVDRSHDQSSLVMPWKLEDGQIYPIGQRRLNQAVQLRARVQQSDPLGIPRLIISPNGIALHYMNRLLLKRSRKDRLRERLTSLDKVERAIIASPLSST